MVRNTADFSGNRILKNGQAWSIPHALLLRQLNMSNVMPDLIRHPGQFWIPAFAGMTDGHILLPE